MDPLERVNSKASNNLLDVLLFEYEPQLAFSLLCAALAQWIRTQRTADMSDDKALDEVARMTKRWLALLPHLGIKQTGAEGAQPILSAAAPAGDNVIPFPLRG